MNNKNFVAKTKRTEIKEIEPIKIEDKPKMNYKAVLTAIAMTLIIIFLLYTSLRLITLSSALPLTIKNSDIQIAVYSMMVFFIGLFLAGLTFLLLLRLGR
jgi:hypothetical protein